MPYKFNPFTGSFDVNGGTGTVSAAGSGSAGTPGIAFASDPDTGLFNPGDGQLAISTNGTGRLFVSSTGIVGIGAAATSTLLELGGVANPQLTFNGTATNGQRGLIFSHNGTAYGQIGQNVSTGEMRLRAGESGQSGYFITFGTGDGSERARIRADGLFEIKGAGTAGSSPAFSVNQSAPSNSFFIDSGGKLGLGTSSPGQNITIQSAASGTAPTFKLQNPIDSNSSSGAANNLSAGQILFGATGSFPVTAKIESAYDSSNASFGRNTKLIFSSINLSGNVVERMTIDSNGYVGINATGPVATLDCRGQFAISNGSSSYWILDRDDSDGRFKLLDTSTSTNERLAVDSSGRLLVGTTTARSNIKVDTTVSQTPIIQLEGSNNSYGTSLSITNYNANSYGPAFALNASKGTQATPAAVVSTGDLGFFTFNGYDGANFIPGAHIAAFVDGTPGTNSMPGRIMFSTTLAGASSPTSRMTINNAGDFYFNTTVTTKTIEGFRIENNGQPNVSRGTNGTFMQFFHAGTGSAIGSISNTGGTATAYNTTSDYRLKENVVSLAGAIDRINNLQVRRFNFIADPDRTVDGFIAHEAQAVVPECVTGEKDAVDADGNPVHQGIDQSKLVPLLTAALQEAIVKIETLEARLIAAGIA